MTHLPEVGQRIEIEGRGYWIAKIVGSTIEVMPESLYNNPSHPINATYKIKEKQGGFFQIFFVIVLVVVLIKLIF